MAKTDKMFLEATVNKAPSGKEWEVTRTPFCGRLCRPRDGSW